MLTEITAALFGAVAGGGLQAVNSFVERRREARSTLMALATEVGTICALLRANRYLEDVQALVAQIGTPEWEARPAILSVDIRASYFTVFDASAPKLGLLKPHDASLVVAFYQMCKTAIDSHRPDGLIARIGNRDDRERHNRAGAVLMASILAVGDQIVQLPAERPVTLNLHQLAAAHQTALPSED
jgi:hypothetical protein